LVANCLVIMGLPEVPALARKFREQLHAGENRELVETVEKITEKFRQYIAMTVPPMHTPCTNHMHSKIVGI